MADQRRIKLRAGHATPGTVVLRELPVADAAAVTTIRLYQGHATAKTIVLSDPSVTRAAAGGVVTGAASFFLVEEFLARGNSFSVYIHHQMFPDCLNHQIIQTIQINFTI